jgi:leucyl-tRNA synthetase
LRAAAHRTLRDVTEDYEGFRFNTMVAKLMELSNTLYRYRGTEVAGDAEWDEAVRLLLLMLAPAAPHITEEIWARQAEVAGREWSSIHAESWPSVDEAAVRVSVREVPVQVNGKLRDRIVVAADASEEQIKAVAQGSPRISAILAGRTPDRIVVAGGGKLVNIVIREG